MVFQAVWGTAFRKAERSGMYAGEVMMRPAFNLFSGPCADKSLVLPRLVGELRTASLKQIPVAFPWDAAIRVGTERYWKTTPSFCASEISNGSAGISFCD